MKLKIFTSLFMILISCFTLLLAQHSQQVRQFDNRKKINEHFGRRNQIPKDMKIPKNIPPFQYYAEKNPLMLDAIIPDFQVNENAGPYEAEQSYASISSESYGNFVITWEDWRNGNSDIYAQRYSADGTKIGDNFKVNKSEAGVLPDISSDHNGNFVITWEDWRNGNSDIYAQRYLADGTTEGNNFKVNKSEAGVLPAISSDHNGNFVITWETQNAIYAQRYLRDGTPLGSYFKVNDDSLTNIFMQFLLSVSMADSGNFVITWECEHDGDYDIYAKRYSSDGSPLGPNFKVNQVEVGFWGGYPSVALKGNGKFMITWTDGRYGSLSNIYAQTFFSDGTPSGDNIRVNDDDGAATQSTPSISADRNGNFVITWYDGRTKNENNVYAQRFLSDGTPVGTNFKVNELDVGYSNSRWYRYVVPNITSAGNGNFIIAWAGTMRGFEDHDIYTQRYLSDGTPQGANLKVNDDVGSSFQHSASISPNVNGNFVIAWIDERNQGSDIYAQRCLSDGSRSGTNFMVNDDVRYSQHDHPCISVGSNGDYFIVWEDDRNYDIDIYAQHYSGDGTPTGTNLKVNDDAGSANQRSPSVFTDESSNYIITWQDWRFGDRDIYAQRFLSDGTPTGNNFMLISNNEGNRNYSSSVYFDNKGNYVITWQDWRIGDRDIYGQRFLSDGTPIGVNFKVNEDTLNNYCVPSISTDGKDNFLIAWKVGHSGVYNGLVEDCEIYGQLFMSDGTPLGNNFIVNDSTILSLSGDLSVSSDDNGNFIITWEENSDILAQRYLSDGSRLGDNFLIPSSSKRTQCDPSVRLLNNKIYTAWTDNHVDGTGFNIWANVLDWDNPVGIEDNEIISVPSGIQLSQNYPNPFNPSTTIKYSIPKQSNVTLKVFDVLGREVATLVNKELSQGNYVVEFDASTLRQAQYNASSATGSELTSGIYFYRLQASDASTLRQAQYNASSAQGFVETKKMILLK